MTTLCITVDGRTVMNGDLGQWTTEPPELKTMIDEVKRNPNPEPYMRDVLTHVAHVGMGGKPRTINITTRPDGYTLAVTYT